MTYPEAPQKIAGAKVTVFRRRKFFCLLHYDYSPELIIRLAYVEFSDTVLEVEASKHGLAAPGRYVGLRICIIIIRIAAPIFLLTASLSSSGACIGIAFEDSKKRYDRKMLLTLVVVKVGRLLRDYLQDFIVIQ